MAKKSKSRNASPGNDSHPAPESSGFHRRSSFRAWVETAWIPLLLATVTFLVYLPSLKSDFVYDAGNEIHDEGFITSVSNLPAVLSLKVLGMHLMLGTRPGQMLYLMLIAAVCGKEPFGYHLCSNLLHATNVALLFVWLRRLIATEVPGLTGGSAFKAQIAAVAVTLIFALHPIAVEPVAAVSYSSDLLVTFFTLVALLAATAFRAEKTRVAVLTGGLGTFCAFAAVTCKESGIAVALLLIVYWFLFRRQETRDPWLCFLGAATTVTLLFLAARFFFAPPGSVHTKYLGGSFIQIFLIQPRLWVFMLEKLLWPTQFSADYTLENVSDISTPVALIVLAMVVSLQIWLASRSRIGALGVAVFWLGLATVSNFVPLFRIVADRFYYLPLAGMAMQLLALLLMALKSRWGFWLALAPLLAALTPFTLLNFDRQAIFANDFSLWSDTVQISPFSSIAHYNLGLVYSKRKGMDEAAIQYQKALVIDPYYVKAHDNLGSALLQKGQVDEAIVQYQTALQLDPSYPKAHDNLGSALLQKGQVDAAIIQYQDSLDLNPTSDEAHFNLGNALFAKGQIDAAILQYQRALEINPDFPEAHTNLGFVLLKTGRVNEAIVHFQEVVRLTPHDGGAQNRLAQALALARQKIGP